MRRGYTQGPCLKDTNNKCKTKTNKQNPQTNTEVSPFCLTLSEFYYLCFQLCFGFFSQDAMLSLCTATQIKSYSPQFCSIFLFILHLYYSGEFLLEEKEEIQKR